MLTNATATLVALLLLSWAPQPDRATGETAFDHTYRLYGTLLRAHVRSGRVDYSALSADSATLGQVVDRFGRVDAGAFAEWPRERRLAYWINAYNVFTLKAVVDHYPIKGSWFSLAPRNSIRQIDGVWDELTWQAGGRTVTLDEIEHGILRPEFHEPRIHFAINCASLSCPPLRPEPYVADRLDAQLDDASHIYLSSVHGVEVDGSTIRVTSILDWYGDDFISAYAALVPDTRSAKARAVLGAVASYGPPAAATLATRPSTRLQFLDYDWSLNDVQR